MENYILQKSLGFKLDAASRLTTGNFSRKLKEASLSITPEQWGIISFLYQEEGVTQNQLTKLVRKDHTCVSRLLDSLIKKGIVKKVPSPEDKRVNHIYLTELGQELENSAVIVSKENLAKVFQGISDEEKEIFSKILDKIIENLE